VIRVRPIAGRSKVVSHHDPVVLTPLGGEGPRRAGGVVYAGSSDENVYALGVADGRRRWKFQTRNEVVAAPVVINSVVYVADASGDIYALRAADRRLLWQYTTGGSVQSSLAVAGNVIYAGDTSGGLWALRAPA
jgi:outer membrane protein assembly factor BamB